MPTPRLQELNLTEMTITQVRQAIKDRYEEARDIQQKYSDTNPLTRDASAEDYDQVKLLLGELDILEDRLAPLEESDRRKDRILRNVAEYQRPSGQNQRFAIADEVLNGKMIPDPGAQFIESESYKQNLQSGIFNNNRNRVEFVVPMGEGTDFLKMSEQKTLVYSGTGSAGSLVTNQRLPGIVDILQRPVVITDFVPTSPTTSDTIEYVRETTFTNNAAFVAEATATTGTSGLKPESALAYDVQTQPVKTMAHWIPITNRMLADAPALRGLINARLLLGLDLALESQIIDGDGAGENLTGILRTEGILIQGKGSDSEVDALYKARTQVMVTGLARPSGYVIHPNDWQTIRLSRENSATATLGAYLYGPPSVQGPMTLWGLPVAEALGIPENTALVGDFALGSMIFDREQSQIRTGLINDQFVRNMQTILAELRMALVIFRPSAFAKITGI